MNKKYYFLTIFILFLFNISFVNALESNFEYLEVRGYNNNGNSLTSPNEFGCSAGSCGMQITTNANSYGGAWLIQSPIPIIKNHNYALSLRIRSSNYEIYLSSKPQIALGNWSTAKTNYETNNFQNELISYRFGGNSTLQYYFKSLTNDGYLLIPFTTQTTTTADFMIDTIVIEDLGTESMTEDQVNNIINNQTNIINNNISGLKDDIDNTLKDTFESCNEVNTKTTNIYSEFTYVGWLNDDGSFYESVGSTWRTSSFIEILPNTKYQLKNASNSAFVFYDSNRNFINIVVSNGNIITSPSNSKYVRFNQNTPSSNISLLRYEEQCSNKLDNLNDTQKETNNKLDDLNDNITDSDTSGASGDAENFFSNFSTDTFGLTSVITAPLELIRSVTSKTCSPLQLTLPFVNKQLNLPCLSTIYENHFGSFLTIYRTITFGFVSYWVCIKIFNLVKDFKNPEHDEIEVLDL